VTTRQLRAHSKVVLLLGVAALLSTVAIADTVAGKDKKQATYRWDIVSIDFSTGTVSAGGIASARASDNSKITLTGSGTFRKKPGRNHISGGGTWKTFAPNGDATGSGSYHVTKLVHFEQAPGSPPPLTDRIGELEDARAGLVVLKIAYSDGSEGTLVVSCHLVGTPDSLFEGVTATKGFVPYWNPEAPVDGVDANRTLFHLLGDDDDDDDDEGRDDDERDEGREDDEGDEGREEARKHKRD
jgi:hypothetical protein